jgi:hypothetical protein
MRFKSAYSKKQKQKQKKTFSTFRVYVREKTRKLEKYTKQKTKNKKQIFFVTYGLSTASVQPQQSYIPHDLSASAAGGRWPRLTRLSTDTDRKRLTDSVLVAI